MSWKDWFVGQCWEAFSMEKWQKRTKTFAILLGVACVLSLIALIISTMLYVQSNSGTTVLVPKERVVTIDGNQYIPIYLV